MRTRPHIMHIYAHYAEKKTHALKIQVHDPSYQAGGTWRTSQLGNRCNDVALLDPTAPTSCSGGAKARHLSLTGYSTACVR
jgi:hypothetical protein